MSKNKPALASNIFAWQGWQAVLKADWQPVRIEGDFYRGRVIIANGDGPVFQVSWQRPKGGQDFDFAAWLARQTARYENADAVKSKSSGDLVITEIAAFSATTEKQPGKRAWWAYSKAAGVVLEISMPDIAAKKEQRFVARETVPQLAIFTPPAAARWQLYQVGFMVPANYVLKQKHLFSGDVGLEFYQGKHERLLLRQVYPAELALSRRRLGRWLTMISPFKRSRRFYQENEEEFAAGGFRGICQSGWQNIPWPLGWIKSRYCCRALLHDTALDRLLLAERISPAPVAFEELMPLLEQMNLPVAED